MNSRTKVQLSNSEIEKIFISAGIENITDIQPLGAGEYNAVYSAKSEGTEYALKIAPKKETPVLAYERSMLQTELYWYSRMKSIEGVSVPKIYYSDLSCKIAPCEFFIMEKIQGGHLNSMKLTDDEKFYAQREKALFAARLHKMKNDRYGYVQNGLHDDWYQALRHMTLALLNDCKLKGKRSRRGERLLRLIDKHSEILKKPSALW
ncbi:MAG: aminoglycoside phosphotransferase family protein [Clostridiales bacterium]|nr:aminoglycoside phosphotransferase family protein [Clostridiales bacterium]